jgi:hypothetical protein
MAYLPQKTYSESDKRERQSVNFINRLLDGTNAYSEIEYGDKRANIDGYIQLLDEDGRINGKLTVQVKTVSPSLEGENKYPCPTSLFAYAERTTDVVFLMAVDHSQQIVLWKYISRPLIKEYCKKDKEKTITLYFDENERLSKENVIETINKWNSLFLKQRSLVANAEEVKDENEKLRRLLINAEAPVFTLPMSDIFKIQRFSDMYNGLLDREFNYIKSYCYPNMWKQGIAIFEYKDTELLYSIYPINYGENSLLIKQLPKDTLEMTQYDMAYHSYVDNKIETNVKKVVKERIANDVKRLFKKPMPVPPYEFHIVEYIREFVHQNRFVLNASRNILKDYVLLKSLIESRFAIHGKIPVVAFLGYNFVHLGLVYDCINYLLNRGYKGDVELYPSKGKYADTGKVSDWFNSESAFKKTQVVINYVFSTYTDFINKNFPIISSSLDMFFNADYVLINLNYSDCPHIIINNFYCTDYSNKQTKTEVEFCLDQQHELYHENPIDSPYHAFKGKTIKYKGKLYDCNSSFCLKSQDVLFSRTCLIDTFYNILKTRLEKYVKEMVIK